MSGDRYRHIERIEAYQREQDFYRIVYDDEAIEIGSYPAADAQKRSPTQLTIDGLLLALRDGYVRSTGRRSTTRGSCTAAGIETWRLHATDPFLITTDEWRSGDFDFERLVLTGRRQRHGHADPAAGRTAWPSKAGSGARSAADKVIAARGGADQDVRSLYLGLLPSVRMAISRLSFFPQIALGPLDPGA